MHQFALPGKSANVRFAGALATAVLLAFCPQARASELDFEVIAGVYPEPSAVGVTLSAPLVGSDADQSSLAGVGTVVLSQDAAPFGSAHITDLVIELTDGMNLELAGISVSASPGDTRVRMLEPGEPGEVVNGEFSQFENQFQFEGFIDLSTQDAPLDLSTVAPVSADLEDIQLEREGGQITANAAFLLEFETTVQAGFFQIPITIEIDGAVLLSANVASPGDYDLDGMLGLGDLNHLAEAIREQQQSFDLNGDNAVDVADLSYWVEELKQSWMGDTDLNGEFNSGDLVRVFSAGQYEDGVPLNSDWSTGDYNGDQEFDSSDIVLAFRGGGYEQGPRAAHAVPEPTQFAGIWLLLGLLSYRRLQ